MVRVCFRQNGLSALPPRARCRPGVLPRRIQAAGFPPRFQLGFRVFLRAFLTTFHPPLTETPCRLGVKTTRLKKSKLKVELRAEGCRAPAGSAPYSRRQKYWNFFPAFC